jgi:arylsulfatase A-like enzyme
MRHAPAVVALIPLVVALGCGPGIPMHLGPLESAPTSPLTLGEQTRPALPSSDSRGWSVATTLPRGNVVLAAGSRAGFRAAGWGLEVRFENAAGVHRLPSGPGDAVLLDGWTEWSFAVPDEIADTSGILILDPVAEPDGRGSLAVARPVVVPERGAHPNVILISIDTLRADRLGCYGNPRETSPSIDALARGGVLFRQVIAPSNWTLPSHFSMMTSLYPSAHGVNPDRALFGGFRRPTGRVVGVRGSGNEQTLAERMAQLGYFTGAITENGWVHPEFGFDQGFASYVAETSGTLETTRSRSLRWLRRHAELPFFLFLHTYQPHQPYDQPPPYDTIFLDPSHVGYALPGFTVPVEMLEDFQAGFYAPTRADLEAFRAVYDGEVRYVDDFVGELMATLAELGIDDRTVVAFTSDHGEEIFEHGRFSHGDALYDEVMRVPWILWGAGVPRGIVVDEPVSLVDILPTLVELAGGVADGPLQGRSVVPSLHGAPLGDRVLFAEGVGKDSIAFYGIWNGKHKLIARVDAPIGDELYDLEADPGERHDRSEQDPARVSQLRAALDAYLVENRALRELFTVEEGEVDPEVVEKLRDLGYID